MKGLVKKVLPFAAAGALMLPGSVYAQEKEKSEEEEFVPKTYWSGELILYGGRGSKNSG